MKSEVSDFRCVAFVSVSVISLICAYNLGKNHCRTDAVRQSPQPTNKMFALQEGQTIVGVSDTTQSMCFYMGPEKGDDCQEGE